MAEKLLNYSTAEILNLFQAAYQDTYGEPMVIGSDNYAAAATISYVLGVLVNSINVAGEQRFLDTATGAYLDTIAAIRGLSRPAAMPASALFRLKRMATGTIAAGELLVSNDDASITFTNAKPLYIEGDCDAILYCTEAGIKGNGYALNTINVVYNDYISEAKNTTVTGGGRDAFTYTTDGDAAFREYIKDRIAEYPVGGSAPSYKSKAFTVDARVQDVYVVQDGDEGYEKGKVKICILWDQATLNATLEALLNADVKAACSASDFRAIGDLIEVYSATRTTYIPAEKIIYPLKFRDVAVAHYTSTNKAYQTYLNSKFGRYYSESELAKRFITPDENGVYAIAFDDTSANASYLAPEAGHYIGFAPYGGDDLSDLMARGIISFVDTGE